MQNSSTKIQRVTRTSEEAQNTYDRISHWYPLLEGIWEKGLRNAGLHMLAAKPGERILEIGFGPGEDILSLASAVGPKGEVVGIDLSPEMAHVASIRAQKADLPGELDLTRGDAQVLPFATGSFDAIYMSFTLELFDTPEISLVLAESQRVLVRRGRIGIVALTKTGKSTWMRRVYEWGHEQFPRVLDCRPIYVCRALDAAGFHIRDANRRSMFGLPVEVVLAEDRRR
jgi:ubiquinone/menaquinone biosynthesis C-methylase UbiE